jgi:hypothetical protein
MKKILFAIAPIAIALVALAQQPVKKMMYAGRWDLTVTTPEATYPSWLEITANESGYAARAQEREGGVHPAAIKVEGQRLIVTVSPAAPARPAADGRPAAPAREEFVWDLTAKGGRLTGVQKRGGKDAGTIAGVLAPTLVRAAPKAWKEPELLFNGKDLNDWYTVNHCQKKTANVNHWVVKDGLMVNEAEGHNIVSKRKFDDFKLHVEFNMDPGANSGIYLRGRYECQMPPPGTRRPNAPAPAASGAGGFGYAIYGFLQAAAPAPCILGEWCAYDITLVGRRVTLAVNGVTLVENQEVPGITGGALDSNEGEPGPIYFQGDHTGGIRFRNVRISTPK